MEERQRLLEEIPADATVPAGFLREIQAVGSQAATSIDRLREVMLVVVENEGACPDDSTWRVLLPSWFVNACAEEQTEAESDEWLRRWRASSLQGRAQMEAATAWALGDWCYWLGENRPWSSWDIRRDGEHVRWRLLVQDDQAPVGAAEWLVTASGLQVVDVR